jgi:hypothetical protein
MEYHTKILLHAQERQIPPACHAQLAVGRDTTYLTFVLQTVTWYVQNAQLLVRPGIMSHWGVHKIMIGNVWHAAPLIALRINITAQTVLPQLIEYVNFVIVFVRLVLLRVLLVQPVSTILVPPVLIAVLDIITGRGVLETLIQHV